MCLVFYLFYLFTCLIVCFHFPQRRNCKVRVASVRKKTTSVSAAKTTRVSAAPRAKSAKSGKAASVKPGKERVSKEAEPRANARVATHEGGWWNERAEKNVPAAVQTAAMRTHAASPPAVSAIENSGGGAARRKYMNTVPAAKTIETHTSANAAQNLDKAIARSDIGAARRVSRVPRARSPENSPIVKSAQGTQSARSRREQKKAAKVSFAAKFAPPSAPSTPLFIPAATSAANTAAEPAKPLHATGERRAERKSFWKRGDGKFKKIRRLED